MTVLAYWDCFEGMVPVKVTAYNGVNCTFTVTATRGPYRRGEELKASASMVIPRAHYHKSRRGPFYYYTTPYSWRELLSTGEIFTQKQEVA